MERYNKKELLYIYDIISSCDGKVIRKCMEDRINLASFSECFLSKIDNPYIKSKIKHDKNFRRYSIFEFFPEVLTALKIDEDVKMNFFLATRGMITRVSAPGLESIIKPIQRIDEHKIAVLADKLGGGPAQKSTVNNFLTEEAIIGETFGDYIENMKNNVSEDELCSLGKKVGNICNVLIDNRIMYGDQMVTHILVVNKELKLIDYGSSRIEDDPSDMARRMYDLITFISYKYSQKEANAFRRGLENISSTVKKGIRGIEENQWDILNY
jgi:hypothetical protein